MKKRLEKDPLQSIIKLSLKYQEEYPNKIVPEYIRHFSIETLVIGIWPRKDVEEFHKKAINLPCFQDATASLATKKQFEKEIHYYAYTLYDSMVKTEPIPFIEILTNCLDERPLQTCLEGYKKNEEALYGHYNLSILTTVVCDFSWPSIKSLLYRFNMETVPIYLQGSSNILTEKTTNEDFRKQCFIHICLSHVIKTFSRKTTKLLKKNEKQDIMFFCSLLANSSVLEIFEDVFKHTFTVLLSKAS